MSYFKRCLAGLALSVVAGPVLASVGGGATIHNVATMNFDGGQISAHVNVQVLTVGSTPTIVSTSEQAFSGDTVVVTYSVTNTSNGADTFDLQVSTNDTGVAAPANLAVAPASLVLGASITSLPSSAGTVFIPAGSETHLAPGDRVRLNIGGTDYFYTLSSVTPGTPATTSGNTTTPEVATALQLAPVGSAPAIIAGNIPVGTQIGEVGSFTVTLDAGAITVPGTGGSHEIEVQGSTTAPGPGGPGDVVVFTDTSGSVAVLSGEATLTKEVRNVTLGGAFATSGVTARPGDVLEYRITASTIPGEDVTGAVLTDQIPQYSRYVEDSTNLNGTAFGAPDSGTFPFAGTGAAINSPGGATGQILDGESAVVLFRVTVE
ncbi:hypothetical protein K8B33_07725 [Alcanivorax sp. JB21]|uniref:hypothetical protein n=1 Tax=Alcanivorax limicola TaxID=2874102 RepID=UPI001CBC8BBC|nr:hypothetical protein [Alcanivorax limicola]MBZ2188981.1 hypothetical protein [Alcanivorax limicola]